MVLTCQRPCGASRSSGICSEWPQASYIGFTGTPLFSDDEITRRVFGEYISTYDFQRAVEDKATVPLYYDSRGDKLGVSVGDLNKRIAAKLAELETDDINVAQRLEQELKPRYTGKVGVFKGIQW